MCVCVCVCVCACSLTFRIDRLIVQINFLRLLDISIPGKIAC